MCTPTPLFGVIKGGAVPIHQIGVGLVFQLQPLGVTASMW